MVKIELSDSWDTSLSLDELNNRIREFFNRYKIKVKKYTDTQIIGKQGSQGDIRFFPLFLRKVIPLEYLGGISPKKIYININTAKKNVQIEVKIEKSVKLFLLTSKMRQQYRDYFDILMNKLKEIIPPLVKFCVYCGTQTVKYDQGYCFNCEKKVFVEYW